MFLVLVLADCITYNLEMRCSMSFRVALFLLQTKSRIHQAHHPTVSAVTRQARTIPWIPAVCADVFRSSVRHCIIELRISKDRWLLGPTQPTGYDSRGKASRARLSDGRRRPPAARRDGRDKAETILWRRFRSGPVIVAVEVERDLGSVFFDLSYRR